MSQLLSLNCQCSALTKELQPQYLTPLIIIISCLFERYIEGASQYVIYFLTTIDTMTILLRKLINC